MNTFTTNYMYSRSRRSLPWLSRCGLGRCLVLLALLAFASQTLGAVVCAAMGTSQPAAAVAMPDCHNAPAPVSEHDYSDCCDNCDLYACHASGVAVHAAVATEISKNLPTLPSHGVRLYMAPAHTLFRPPISA